VVRSRSGRKSVGLAGALLLTLISTGCGLSPSTEDAYLKEIGIAGHERVATHYNTGLFLGPPTADLLSAVSGPDLQASPSRTNLSSEEWEFVGIGTGKADDGTECRVHFERLTKGPDPAFPDWEPSADQRKKLTAGELEIIRVAVGCPFET
jgi:hypothetical protein